jgi:hypothetical protein
MKRAGGGSENVGPSNGGDGEAAVVDIGCRTSPK